MIRYAPTTKTTILFRWAACKYSTNPTSNPILLHNGCPEEDCHPAGHQVHPGHAQQLSEQHQQNMEHNMQRWPRVRGNHPLESGHPGHICQCFVDGSDSGEGEI